ncbi:MAG: peptidyl-prolyl cis-trans isomerase [Candidatus Binatia bacterium]
MKEIHANRVRRWLREPLLHFVVLGVAVFALHRWVAPPGMSRRIELTDDVIHGLRQDHLRRYGTVPTAAEEAAIIQQFVDNEVLYREALALGLDRGDIVVRRRLVQKMEFLTEDLEPIPEPTDAVLQAYLDAHAEPYAIAARVALTHVFISTDRHADHAAADAAQLRQQLLAGADPAALGDPFLRGRDFAASTQAELSAVFGAAFAAQVMSLPVGSWSEPVRSSYGWHLVRVTARADGYAPNLAEVRAAVDRDWREERRSELNRLALARLRRRYDIRIAGAPPGSALAQVSP